MANTDQGNWAPGIVGLLTVLLALVIIVTLLRIYTRVWIAHSFWWDDVTLILATIGTTLGAALGYVEVNYGFGKHFASLSDHQRLEFLKYTFGEWIQTFFTLMWTKVSICLFLMRIPHSKALRRPLEWAVAFLIISNTVLTVMWIMQCQPVRAAWDMSGQWTCMHQGGKEAIILTQAVISIVSDLVFAMFPVLLLWRVQIDLKTKFGLWILMGLGLITAACCIVRTVINNQALPADASYDGIVNWVWRTFEVQIGIIAACIPTLRPLYLRLMGRHPSADGSLGSNVKYPLSQVAHQAWMEGPKKSDQISRGHDHDLESNAVSSEREGNKGDNYRSPLPYQGQETRNASLGDEMARYGIKDEP